jgi:hypothetical protein
MSVTSAVAVNPAVYIPVQTTMPYAPQGKENMLPFADGFINDGAQRSAALHNEHNANNYNANVTKHSSSNLTPIHKLNMGQTKMNDGLILPHTSARLFGHTQLCCPALEAFYQGSGSLDAVKSSMEDVFYHFLTENIKNGATDMGNTSDIMKILDATFQFFMQNHISGAHHANIAEGVTLHGHGVVYYNAKYFHMAEDAFHALQETYYEIAARFGVLKENANPPPRHPVNFNANWWAGTAPLTDPSMVPPKDFVLSFNPRTFCPEKTQWTEPMAFAVPGASFTMMFPAGVSMFRPGKSFDLNALRTLFNGGRPLQDMNTEKIEVPKDILFNVTPLLLSHIKSHPSLINHPLFAGQLHLMNRPLLNHPLLSLDIHAAHPGSTRAQNDVLQDVLDRIMDEYFINPEAGRVSITTNGATTTHDLEFRSFYDRQRHMFSGAEIFNRNFDMTNEATNFAHNFTFYSNENARWNS